MKLCLLSLWYFRKVCSSKIYKRSQEDFLDVMLAFPRLLRKDEKKCNITRKKAHNDLTQPKAGWKKGEIMQPIISIIMGSKSDWETMKKAAQVLEDFGVAYEKKVVSAHRTPDLMFRYAEEARVRGIKVIIAGAGGAAHLPGMVAAKTTLPVIGVPVKSRALSGVDSLYSIVQMPGGVPVATMAIGEAGATNAALFALRWLSVEDAKIAQALADFTEKQGKIAEESSNELN